MKKYIVSLVLLLAMLVTILPAAVSAQPEGAVASFDLVVSMDAQNKVFPDSKGTYNTKLTFLIKNTKHELFTDITIYPEGSDTALSITAVNESGEPLNSIAANVTSMTLTVAQYTVPKDKVGQDINFIVTWKRSDPADTNVYYAPAHFTSELYSPQLEITASCTQADTAVFSGAKTEITYTVKNTGNCPLTNVAVNDPEVAALLGNTSSAVKTYPSIEPGATLQDVIEVTVKKEFKSAASVSAQYYTATVGDAAKEFSIFLSSVDFELSVTADSYTITAGDEVTFTYTIKNTSNLELQEIYLLNNAGTTMNPETPFNVPAGETVTGTFPDSPADSGLYLLTVKYRYDGATGEATKSVKTDTNFTVRVPAEISLQIVSCSPEKLTGPGSVTFFLTVTNSSSYDLESALITASYKQFDANGGVQVKTQQLTVENLAAEATSDQQSMTIDIQAETAIDFVVEAEHHGLTSSSKLTKQINFNEEIDLSSPTPDPAVENGNGTSLKLVLYIVAAVLVLVSIAVIVLLIIRGKQDERPFGAAPVRRKIIDDDEYSDDYTFEESEEEQAPDGTNESTLDGTQYKNPNDFNN